MGCCGIYYSSQRLRDVFSFLSPGFLSSPLCSSVCRGKGLLWLTDFFSSLALRLGVLTSGMGGRTCETSLTWLRLTSLVEVGRGILDFGRLLGVLAGVELKA